MIQPLTRSSCLAYVTFISTLPISLARSPHITLTLSPPPSHKRRTQHGRISSLGPLHLITLYIVKMLKAVSAAPVPGCHQLTYLLRILAERRQRLQTCRRQFFKFGILWVMDGIQLLCALCFQVTQTKLPHESIRDFRTTMVTCDPYGRHTACTPPAESDKYIQSRYLAMRN